MLLIVDLISTELSLNLERNIILPDSLYDQNIIN
jgi:hypothetical protein